MNKLTQVALLVVGCSAALLAGTPGFSAPEIDAGSAATAIALVSGIILIGRGRAKR
jgi:hypothetical protein